MNETEGPGTSEGPRESRAVMNVDDLELELRKLPGVRAAGFSEREDVLLIQLQVSGEPAPPNLPLQATRIAYRHSDKPVALEIVRWRVMPATRDHTGVGGEGDQGVDVGLDNGGGGIDETTTASLSEALAPPPEPVPIATEIARPAAAAPAPVAATRGTRVRLLAVLTFPDTDELEVHLTYEGRRIIGRATASHGLVAVVDAMVDGLKVFAPRLEYTSSWARVLDDDREHHLVACELVAPDQSRRLGIAAGASAIEATARATLHALNRTVARHLLEEAVQVESG